MKPYYEDSWTQIFHGDCREILPELGPISHVITDPPYGEHVHLKQWIGHEWTSKKRPRMSTHHKQLGFDPITPELQLVVCEQARRLAERWTLIFCDIEGINTWRGPLAYAGLEYIRSCIWDKIDSAPQFTGDRPASGAEAIICAHRPGKKRWNGGGSKNVFRCSCNQFQRGPKPHPSTKPEPLMMELIHLFTDPGETILDPFMGSGSTLAAAKRLGRRSIGIEIEEKYCRIAVDRLRQESLLGLIQSIERERTQ